MPLKAYTFAGEGNVLADGKVLADAEKLVMSLRVTGSETVGAHGDQLRKRMGKCLCGRGNCSLAAKAG